MNERKLLVDTDTKHTMTTGLQHSEAFTSLTSFVGKIKIEHFFFLGGWSILTPTVCSKKKPSIYKLAFGTRIFFVQAHTIL